ncbi:DNA protecting protein DprA [Candidatus Uhrbacteria bacterium RIFCSPLOWO2_01_FULL_47_24]|uniref:DNA protecting protein DprA n=1 Tax=Candidatus Uhrbacteria bacterium RIFCSPLOWO2_01_FULL_47_24 TaxID=1802401 RepID=A0A1F7UPF8_9BACT|nr:MAG: DNA protecting protein DprA [Candidatus Uhrbacteria bacterium RIFCSPHIGHO2_01_FULL_47_11]OGL68101.1 MAG: DNA protecting protein DprA [Candidatus Uhrbacteria bacterium RIFCSPHIGHO2_02_FULL_46_47]OGL75754.1 MAG: DNA protecting protein DprA [Candidatus Uhrbacteria bacterium RIFCSPHIGHO2_12_FULL_47_11]OGL80193.1 MAG: DNA protecting protein DprA [Candidatus Uhrbacteria bacterium RIFCSPLOWO2_01_FULL_47_24]OGL84979.1 MAG: DNA protecting protein DprA [Candidatus Uhrbacteria bacterium RIFCSPLOWO
MENEKIYYQALARFDKIGPLRLRTLLKSFTSVEQIWHASAQDLTRSGLDENVATEFVSWRKDQDIEKQWEELQKEGIQVVTWGDAPPHLASGHPLPQGEGRGEGKYPSLLAEIHDPPHTLFVRTAHPLLTSPIKREGQIGSSPPLVGGVRGGEIFDNTFTLAVVGTRMATTYGRQIVEQIVGPLARSGLTIVSGLALGVDALAHDVTVREGGTTIAVLGGGCDRASIYPTSNRALAERIIEKGGAVISEYPPGTLAMPFHFPHRNRIISGMSRGTFVIEATEDSGSLITAKHALEQNREVFTVPGDITRDTSRGPNNLLKMGAHPVLCADDILDALNLQDLKATIEARKIMPDDPTEEKILAHLGDEPVHIDELVEKTQMQAGETASCLTLMEMKGKVRHIGGMNYVLAH